MTRNEIRRAFKAAAGRGVRVAVVDSGWMSELIDPRVRPVVDVGLARATPPGDGLRHGTLCALRVLQVAVETEIVPIRIFRGRLEASVEDVCRGIRAAEDAGAQVINLSLATVRKDAVIPLYRACARARRAGIVLVAASHDHDGPVTPAHLEPVLSVEGGPQTDILEFTFERDAAVECTAASAGVPVAGLASGPARAAGASIAAATMSGIVARLLQVEPGDLDHVRDLLSLACHDPSGSRGPPDGRRHQPHAEHV